MQAERPERGPAGLHRLLGAAAGAQWSRIDHSSLMADKWKCFKIRNTLHSFLN